MIEISLPGSKSISNRALLLAALAKGRTTLLNLLFSEDTINCIDGLRKLGFEIQDSPSLRRVTIEGGDGDIKEIEASLYIGNAGTASRFLTAMLCLKKGTYNISGIPRMHERPVAPLVDALRTLGVSIAYLGKSGCLPLEISSPGAEFLASSSIEIESNISSQFLSALMQISPYLAKPLVIKAKNELASKPYLEMTLKVMQKFGALDKDTDTSSLFKDENTIDLTALQRLKSPDEYHIEPDASTAAYYFSLGMFSKKPLRLLGLDHNSIQGDYAFLGFLESLGAKVATNKGWTEVCYGEFRQIDEAFDFNTIPDQVMTGCVLAAMTKSDIKFTNVENLRFKECNRLEATKAELEKLGVQCEIGKSWIKVFGKNGAGKKKGIEIACYDDHRMAMSFALFKLTKPKITFDKPACVAKTSPDFWERFEEILDLIEPVLP